MEPVIYLELDNMGKYASKQDTELEQYNTNSKSRAGNAVTLYLVRGFCPANNLKPQLSALCSLLNGILNQNPVTVVGENNVSG